jgi:hypothetical protein
MELALALVLFVILVAAWMVLPATTMESTREAAPPARDAAPADGLPMPAHR